MKIRIYGRKNSDKFKTYKYEAYVEQSGSAFSAEEITLLEAGGAIRSRCPCCTLPIVIRKKGTELDAEDYAFLMPPQ